MKLYQWILMVSIISVLSLSFLALGAADKNNLGKGPIDKITFVHYPQNSASHPASPLSTDPVLSSTFKYSGIHWTNSDVPYYINTSGSGVTSASKAVQESFTTWNNASNGKISFTDEGATSKVGGGNSDSTNVISWGVLSDSNAIAITYVWYYRYSKEIVECDTIMNTAPGFTWSYTAPNVSNDLSSPATKDSSRYADPTNSGVSGSYDVQNIMTHEAGHWIMLGDLYNSRDSYLTMYGYGSKGELKKDTLGYGDELGIEKAYP